MDSLPLQNKTPKTTSANSPLSPFHTLQSDTGEAPAPASPVAPSKKLEWGNTDTSWGPVNPNAPHAPKPQGSTVGKSLMEAVTGIAGPILKAEGAPTPTAKAEIHITEPIGKTSQVHTMAKDSDASLRAEKMVPSATAGNTVIGPALSPLMGQAKVATPTSLQDAIGGKSAPNLGAGVIHTYADDVSHVVKFQDASIARIAVAESKKKEGEVKVAPSRASAVALMFVSIFLIAAGAASIGILVVLKKASPPLPEDITALIHTENTKEILLTTENSKDELERGLAEARSNTLPYGTLERLLLTATEISPKGETIRPITTFELFSLIEVELLPSLLRAFEPDFLLGFHGLSEPKPFLLIRISSFDNAYAGMLRWEPTMAEDLAPLFGFKRGVVRVEGNAFSDAVVKNKDVRFQKDEEGNIKLIYSFVDNRTIGIATSDRTLVEIWERLRTANLIR